MNRMKKTVLTICFAVVLALGLIFTFASPELAELKSREYDGQGAYIVYDDDVSRNMVPFVAGGCLLSLLAGSGLVAALLKD